MSSRRREAEVFDRLYALLSKIPIPVHGNWCGPNYGSGTPVDELDRLCMIHDNEYDKGNYLKADFEFARALKKENSIKARAVGLFFEKVMIPARQSGILPKSAEKSEDKTMAKQQPWKLIPASTYSTFIGEYGVWTGSVNVIPALDYVCKDGFCYQDLAFSPVHAGAPVWNASTWAAMCGDAPRNTDDAKKWRFAPWTNGVYCATLTANDPVGLAVGTPSHIQIGLAAPNATWAGAFLQAPELNLVTTGTNNDFHFIKVPIGDANAPNTVSFKFYFRVKAGGGPVDVIPCFRCFDTNVGVWHNLFWSCEGVAPVAVGGHY